MPGLGGHGSGWVSMAPNGHLRLWMGVHGSRSASTAPDRHLQLRTGIHSSRRESMDPDGCPWIQTGIHGSEWPSTAQDGRPQLWMGIHRSGWVAHGSRWASTDPNGHPWLRMDARREPTFQKDQDLTSSPIKRESAWQGFTAHPTDAGEGGRTRSGDKFLQQTLPTDKTHPGAPSGERRRLPGAPQFLSHPISSG